MVKKILLIAVGVLLVGLVGLFLVVRSLLAPDRVRAAVERQASVAVGQPVHVDSASVSVFPRAGVELRGVAIGEPAAVTFERVSLATGLPALLSGRVEGAAIIVADSRILLPLPFRLGGDGSAGAAPAGETEEASEEPALTIDSIDAIVLDNLQLAVGDKTLRVDLDSSLTGDRLDIRRIRATSDQTTLEATGTLTSLSQRQGSLDIKGDPLDLDELLAILSGIATTGESAEASRNDTPAATRSGGGPLQIQVSLTAPRGRLAGYDFVDLAATLDMSTTRLALEPFGFGIFGGRYDGTAAVALTDATPALSLDGVFRDVNMAQVVEAAGSPGVMTGTLAGSLSLRGQGSDSNSMLRAAHGRADAAIVDGHIPGLEMVRVVVLALGKPSGAPPEGSGSAFSTLGGTFTLSNGVLSSDDIAFASRDLDMRAEGTVSLVTGALDIDADIILSDELSSHAGTDLVKFTQEKGRVVLPGTITGTVEHPKIFVDVKEAAGRAAKRGAESLIKGLIKKKP